MNGDLSRKNIYFFSMSLDWNINGGIMEFNGTMGYETNNITWQVVAKFHHYGTGIDSGCRWLPSNPTLYGAFSS